LSPTLSKRLGLLRDPAVQPLLTDCRHGIEKESLRVTADGMLVQSAHPVKLGSALTHPTITTDYSEALIELITPVSRSIDELFSNLDEVHRFTYSHLGEERLWNQSMPCRLPVTDNDIPIAWYGTSNVGTLKHVYRRGLAIRYGKAMQCIAGVHYNFSLPPALWAQLKKQDQDTRSEQQYQSERYFALTRNFRRYAWLLMYLFGASPAVCASFLQGRDHRLQPLGDKSLYLPYATSLRMSDLGYNNNAQSDLNVCHNSLDAYIASMLDAISLPYEPYSKLGTHDAKGEWQQLNTNLLQIENEFYSPIRPKRVAQSGEKPLHALVERGVEYIEVRCLDIDPFAPLGVDPDTAHFMDAFLLFCALQDSPRLEDAECQSASDNFNLAVKRGREPGLQLQDNGQERTLVDWGNNLLDSISDCAALLDSANDTQRFSASLEQQRHKLADASLTPSARVLAAIAEQGDSFFRFALAQSEEHNRYFRARPLDAQAQTQCEAAAAQSLAEQQAIEAADTLDFDSYVARYLTQPD
tara:strand:+ start:4895 stop:6472 length:1578 start_codon:yes stop_codon:yes gene_type:complete